MGNICYQRSYKVKEPEYRNIKLDGPVTTIVEPHYTTSFKKYIQSTPKVTTNRVKDITPPCSPIMIDRNEGVTVGLIL